MGVSKWATPYELWRQKLGFSSGRDNSAMSYGREMEPLIREKLNTELQRDFQPLVVEHDEIQWASASLDGWDEVTECAAEIKVANAADHETAASGQVPEHYYPQVQWQMFVTGLPRMFYASYHQGDLKIVMAERDDSYIEKCLAAARQFMTYLEEYEEPPLHESDHLTLDDPEFLELAQKYRVVREKSDKYAKMERELRSEMLDFTDDGNCEGGGVRFTRVRRDGAIDYKSLVADIFAKDSDLAVEFDPDKYRKDEVGYWKVSLV